MCPFLRDKTNQVPVRTGGPAEIPLLQPPQKPLWKGGSLHTHSQETPEGLQGFFILTFHQSDPAGTVCISSKPTALAPQMLLISKGKSPLPKMKGFPASHPVKAFNGCAEPPIWAPAC